VTLYTIVKSLLMPPGLFVLLLAAAFLLARGTAARLLIFVTASLLFLMSLPVVSVALTAPLEPYPALSAETLPRDADAILVLSAGRISDAPEYGGDTVDGFTMQRLRYGAHLHRLTGLPVYLAGGTPEERGPPMAVLMERALTGELGIRAAGMETDSRTTWENAAYSRPMLERDGIRHVLLVTSAWHMPRSLEAFRSAGIRATAAPTGFVYRPELGPDGAHGLEVSDWLPDARAFLQSYYALHEHIGRLWYQLRLMVEGEPGGG
jgi:uncharacterized SAM-binding protein YcdF (DUF218 family)